VVKLYRQAASRSIDQWSDAPAGQIGRSSNGRRLTCFLEAWGSTPLMRWIVVDSLDLFDKASGQSGGKLLAQCVYPLQRSLGDMTGFIKESEVRYGTRLRAGNLFGLIAFCHGSTLA
jgi:hypothetical protein